MKIRDDHLNHGAALIQIAEHPQFTAINSLKTGGKKHENAYKINSDIAVYLKYATKPVGRMKEYAFTFTKKHLNEIDEIARSNNGTFLALVCVKDREICCLPLDNLRELIARRRGKFGAPEEQYVIVVTIPAGRRFRVYINAPNRRNIKLGRDVIVPRNSFPNTLFK